MKRSLGLASMVGSKRIAAVPAVGLLSYITAILPQARQRVCGLSYELPLLEGTPEQEHELHEFIQLAIDFGAVGFRREDVPTCDGMIVFRDVKRLATFAAHPETVDRSSQDQLTPKGRA